MIGNMKETSRSHLDRAMQEINKHLGNWGRYQAYVVALLFVPGFLGGCHTLISSFTLASPNSRCFVQGLDDATDSPSYWTPFRNDLAKFVLLTEDKQAGKDAYCSYCPFNQSLIFMNITCDESSARRCDHGRIYDTSQYHSTLSILFDMVCENAFQRELLRSLFMVGVLVGAAVFGYISDKIGRKKTFVICSLGEILIFNVVPVATNYYLFCVLEFFGAAAQYGSYLTGFIIAMEMINGLPGTIVGVSFQGFFTVGYLYVGLMAYLIRDWQWLQFSVSILTVLYLPYYWLLPDSLRWLMINGRREEAQQTLAKACKMNGVPVLELPPKEILMKDQAAANTTILDLFRHKKLAIYTCIIFFTWFVCSLTYYGLSLNTADLPGDDYVNFILSGIFELPGLALCIPLMRKLGRKPTLILLLGGAGIFCIASGLISTEATTAIVVCATIGKMFIAGAFAVIYNYSAEIFPTVVRNAGTGFSSLFARLGSICAPQVHLLSYYVAHWVPIVIYGGFALAAALADVFLPETKGQPMPETLEDTLRIDDSGKKNVRRKEVFSTPELSSCHFDN